MQTVAFLSYLFYQHAQYGPFLVIVPLSTITAWQMQFAAWAPVLNGICYIGSSRSREVTRNYELYSDPLATNKAKKVKANVLLTSQEERLRGLAPRRPY